MGLFGRKKEEGTVVVTKTPRMEGWLAECGPACGFMSRNHNKDELTQMLQLHSKNTHKTNMTAAEAKAGLKPTSWGG
jgi:predicted small metal-binding protein